MTNGLAPVAFAQTKRHVAAPGEQHCDPVDLDSSTAGRRIVGWTVVTVTDGYLANNAEYAKNFDGPLPLPPSKHVAVLACMDARIDVYRALGINEGESHVIRNAGGVVTDDAIRSLAISQRLLGTTEIILIHHTDCGMLTFADDDFKRAIQDETGVKPPWSAEAFPDVAEDVRQSLQRIENSPFVTKHTSARGFIFDVATGKLDEVTL
jgi:carbonic anhydrase